MPVTAVVGAQWGDEGKGKIVDLLARDADIVARFGGGSNAGHTIVNEFGAFKLHSLPSGAFNPRALNIVGTGTVVDFDSLSFEIEHVLASGISNVQLAVSDRAHVVMPYHKVLDRTREQRRGAMQVGTTGQGIGPAYVDKVDRVGVQAGELLDIDRLSRRLRPLLDLKRSDVGQSLADEFELDPILEKARAWRAEFGNNIRDTVEILRQAIDDDAQILLEGQLGIMRDLDWGTYPYVTSSTTFAAGAGSGAGLPPREIRNIVAVVKAYTTAVGAGPLPTEMQGPDATNLRERGHEYGATTGRPRRVGWLDGVALRYAAEVGAFSSLAITKLDVLDGMDPVKIAVAYTVDGHALERFPHPSRLDDAQPVYEDLPGWTIPTGNARKLDDLPDSARHYVRRIEEIAGVPVSLIGVGETRDAIIELKGVRPMLAVG